MKRNLEIKHKVIVGITIIVLINIILGLVTEFIEKNIDYKNEQIIDELNAIHDLKDGYTNHLNWIKELNDFLLNDIPFNSEPKFSYCDFDKWLNYFINDETYLRSNEKFKNIILDISNYHKDLHILTAEAIRAYNEGNHTVASKLNETDITTSYENLMASIKLAENNIHNEAETYTNQVDKLSRGIDIFIFTAIIISLFSAFTVIMILIKETIKPLTSLIEKIRTMNENELYEEIDILYSSFEMKRLILIFNNMVHKVNSQQKNLHDQNEELVAQGEELAAQNEELSAQTEELANQNSIILKHEHDIQETLHDLANQEKQLERLYQFSKLLTQTIDQGELIKHVLEGLQEDFEAQVGVFILYNENRELLEVKYASGILNPANMVSLRLGEGLAGRAAANHKAVIANYHESQLKTQGLFGEMTMSYEIYQPLLIHNRLLGVIVLGRLEDHSFSLPEQNLLSSMANQIAVALDNALTHQQTQESLIKIQDLDKLKSEMINTVSHELRTPLASILGFTELLINKSPNEEKTKKYLATIFNEAKRLKLLINDFLDLQKIENGRFDFDKKEVNLNDLLKKCIGVYEGQENGKHTIELNTVSNLPNILTDPDRISQVVGNLLSNAIKYSPNGGKIEIMAYQSSPTQIAVTVKDQGLGIPQEALKDLFKPFYRVDNSDRREIGGTGLGLAICQKMIRALGGEIWVESVHGQGSSFRFTLPLSDITVNFNQAPSKIVNPIAKAKGQILIVEDDQALSNLMSEGLQEDGYKTVVFDNGAAALTFLKDHTPQVIILDLILVGPLDGWEVLRRLKLNESSKNIPVIISSSVDQKERGKSYQVADYLVKPFPQEKLLNSIHTITQTSLGSVGIPQHIQEHNTEITIKQLLNENGFTVRDIKKHNDIYVTDIEPQNS